MKSTLIPKWLLWILGSLVFIAATVGLMWLAGFLFVLFSKTNPLGKTNFLTWWIYWQHYNADSIIAKRLNISAIVAAIIAYGLPIVAVIIISREVRSLHGEARFSNLSEIKQAGLLGSTGIIIGKLKNRFLMFSGAQFVLLAAPTRSGKGVGIVIPNLLNWSESVVILDIKLENFLITSKFRAQGGQDVYLFNPFCLNDQSQGNPLQGRTHRYNPLGYISDDPRLRITDILAIGYSLYPGEGRDAFFDDAARNLFLGLTLYLCETPSLSRTMGELLRQSSGQGQPIKDHIQNFVIERNYRTFGDVILTEVGENRSAVIEALVAITAMNETAINILCDELPAVIVKDLAVSKIITIEKQLKILGAGMTITYRQQPIIDWQGEGLPPLTRECVDALNRFTATSDNTLSSIIATFNVPLTLWASPIIDAATSTNDFDLRDIRRKRMSIYLGIPANKLAEAKLLINMFYTQLISLNTDCLLHATPELKYTCLLLNDEFTAPGRIGIIDKANSYMAGYGLRMLNIVQSPGQLQADPPHGYGRENARTLVTNHACQIFFTPREQRDANDYSEALGYYTFKAKSHSRQLGSKANGRHSESESDQKRALMLPQELKEMSQNLQIINIENTKAILCEKINYFSDSVFIDRLKSVTPSLAKLKKLPTRQQLEKAWASGECAAPIPELDFKSCKMTATDHQRSLDVAKLVQNIDLTALAREFAEQADDEITSEQAELFADKFFAAIDAADMSIKAPDEIIVDKPTNVRPHSSIIDLSLLDSTIPSDEDVKLN